ncbi:MAG: hypothetical protein EPO21_11795 [Chloroflexota bacterium]|nr:MAG: hypothetical protein EPO21_11795 [Chloroflexota bacterium]
MELQNVAGLAGVPVIVALVEGFKRFYPGEERVYPLVAIGFGLAINVGLAWTSIGNLRLAIVYGIVAGLAASGLYSGTRSTLSKD